MRTSRTTVLLFLCSLIPVSLSAQQPAPASVPATTILQQSLAALTGGAPVTDVTMTGTVTVAIGSTTETGTVTFVATATGQSIGTLTMPSGTRTNIRDYSSTPHIGTMILPSGNSEPENLENLTGPHPAWFYPPFILASSSRPNYLNAAIGLETRDGASVQHAAIWPQGPAGTRLRSEQILGQRLPAAAGAPQRAGQYDFYLDPTSFLPIALTINLRATTPPVNGVSVPATLPGLHDPVYQQEEFRFSGYQQVQGRMVAFHIENRVGKNYLMVIQISSVNFNTGATVAAAN